MLDSMTIDHGRKARTRVGRCADCRQEGVITPTTEAFAGMFMCELHKESRLAIWNDCQACYADYYGGPVVRNPRLCERCNDIRRETL